MKVIEVEVAKIKIPQDRYRKDLGDIESLAQSISLHGQLVPIIVNEKMVLIAGERRLRAHILLNKPTIFAQVETADELRHRVLEIIENLDRKQFDWKEAVIATEELHRILKSEYGHKWSERKTAEKLNLASSNVCDNLNLAEALKTVPDIFEGCKTREQALKALKKFKIDEAKAELMLRKSKTNFGEKAKNYVFHGDCLDLIDHLKKESVDALISDPIYGMDLFEKRFENRELPKSMRSESYEDSPEDFNRVLPELIKKASTVLKPDAAVLMFCAFQNAQFLIDLWHAEGFSMDTIPAIWVRNAHAGRTSRPEKYFNRCYDMMVYGLRGNAVLAKTGGGNVLTYAGIPFLEREHPSEKPIALLEDLICRLCLPGQVILDPMCGAGSVLVAAIKRACIPIGFEIEKPYYDRALSNVAKALQFKDAGKLDMIGVKE